MDSFFAKIIAFLALIPTLLFGGQQAKNNTNPVITGAPNIRRGQANTQISANQAKVSPVSGVSLALVALDDGQMSVNVKKKYAIQATFSSGSPHLTIDAFKAVISYDPAYVKLSDDEIIDISASRLDTIFRVDSPKEANVNGKAIIAMGAVSPGSGPSTDTPITFATFTFQGVSPISAGVISLEKMQMVDNNSNDIPLPAAQAVYSIK
jgi:hypothetical protein